MVESDFAAKKADLAAAAVAVAVEIVPDKKLLALPVELLEYATVAAKKI